jgi:glycosyltransferase involved in cell wall biosynthesis
MNVLYVHNYYQNPGGEDQAFAAESALMESKGHSVRRYSMHNDAIEGMNRFQLAARLIWNRDSAKAIYEIVRRNRIEVVHFHNTFPLTSPSAYYAARKAGARVVQTLHNFRLVCPGALLYREGRVCEDCLGKAVPWKAVQHTCYRNSAVQSAALTTMLASHRLMRTWDRQVDLYIALSDFARSKLIQGGLPPARLAVKPNFIDPDPGPGDGSGGYALFVGRLSPDKGVDILLNAWKIIGKRMPLKIAGAGPMTTDLTAAAVPGSGIEYLGHRKREEILDLMKSASFLVFPSLWYEGLPMTIIEAFASGLPVIASDLGTMASLVKHRATGLRFAPGYAAGLISSVQWLQTHGEEVRKFRTNARREFELHYSAETNYRHLMRLYGRVIGSERGSCRPNTSAEAA